MLETLYDPSQRKYHDIFSTFVSGNVDRFYLGGSLDDDSLIAGEYSRGVGVVCDNCSDKVEKY